MREEVPIAHLALHSGVFLVLSCVQPSIFCGLFKVCDVHIDPFIHLFATISASYSHERGQHEEVVEKQNILAESRNAWYRQRR